MISIARLRTHLDGDWVVFDPRGHMLPHAVPRDVGPAALLVTPVVDALKRVDADGLVVESVDRDRMWSVEAIVLNRIALDRLDDTMLTAGELLDAVRSSGLVWQISPISAP